MKSVDKNFLKENAFNMRWAQVAEGTVPLTAADWDIPNAPQVKEALLSYIEFQSTPYGPSNGMFAFKNAVANHFNVHKKTNIKVEEIVATNSAAKAIDNVYSFLLKEGEDILIADPVDFLLAECARRKNINILRYKQTRAGINIQELNKLVTKNSKAIVICNPHNPLGFVLSKEQLIELVEWAESKKLIVISDEVWSDVVYAPKNFVSIRAITANAWVVYGLSKGFGLAGMRIGTVIAPTEQDAIALAEYCGYERTIEGASVLSQVAATAALNSGWNYSQEAFLLFRTNLAKAVTEFNQTNYLSCSLPDGTFVLSVHHPKNWNSEELCKRLSEEAKVNVVPGLEKWFGPGAIGSFRISLATTHDIATEGIQRICNWINTYGSTL